MRRALWHYVRAGQIREALEYCRASRQWWRAASIGGGTAWQWDGAKGKWVGNPRRSLWRGACAARWSPPCSERLGKCSPQNAAHSPCAPPLLSAAALAAQIDDGGQASNADGESGRTHPPGAADAVIDDNAD